MCAYQHPESDLCFSRMCGVCVHLAYAARMACVSCGEVLASQCVCSAVTQVARGAANRMAKLGATAAALQLLHACLAPVRLHQAWLCCVPQK